MNPKILLRISTLLILLTSLGHTIGTFMPIPDEQVQIKSTIEVMKNTWVPMPVGKSQNYFDIFFGNNICFSMFLVILGISFLMLSNEVSLTRFHRKQLFLNCVGLCFISLISGLYFFPIPAVFTGISAILGFYVWKKS